MLGDVTVDRVLFSGDTATGVVTADGTEVRAREVILSAGAYGSASILLRSGVGPAQDLTALGIDVVSPLPVGRRLQDHAFFHTIYAVAPEYVQQGTYIGAFLWTTSPEAVGDELDLQIVAAGIPDPSLSPTGGAFALSTSVVQPESHGTIRLASTDPNEAPLIDENLLGTERDRRRMLAGAKLSREFATHPSLTPYLQGELFPGIAELDDEALLRAIESGLATYGHPTSTAPMGGPDDPWAVVDSRGAVNGVHGLRVVDASILPRIPSGVTNLTIIMIAERIARLVYGG